jgi:hypothetical protein
VRVFFCGQRNELGAKCGLLWRSRNCLQFFCARGWQQKKKKELTKFTKKQISAPKKYFPGVFFLKRTQFFSRVFELPLPRNAQKTLKGN